VTSPTQIGSSGNSLREAFGRSLVQLANKYDFYVLDGDVAGGTGVHSFRDCFPKRYINAGIAEQNMMGVAAGISLETDLPVFVTGFATFLMRAWEIARLSVAYNNANVKIIASHVGLDVGPDGASAQSLEDISCWRAVPNMTVLAPCDPREVYLATEAILNIKTPIYMRTGRSNIAGRVYSDDWDKFEIGCGHVITTHKQAKTVLIGHGSTVYTCVQAAHNLYEKSYPVTVVNISTIKPIDVPLLTKLARKHTRFIVIEDHNIYGGLGSAVSDVLAKCHPRHVRFVGVRNTFGESGEPDELMVKYGLDVDTLINIVLQEDV
jgi:transketolase